MTSTETKGNNDKTVLFESMPIGKAVAKLAIPTVVGCLVMVLYNLADTYFVGMLNDPLENAAVTLAAPVILAFNALINLFGVGTSSLMSRALGLKDYNLVRRSSAFGFYCAIIGGVLLSTFAFVFKTPLLGLLGANEATSAATIRYMFWTVFLGATPSILNVVMGNLVRAEGAAFHASIGTMSGCLLNIILDPIFILPSGLNMGAAGAGMATFISNCIACLYFVILVIVKRGSTYVSFRPSDFVLKASMVGEIFAVGVPAAIQNLLNVTGMTILNNLMSRYGEEAVAAIGIAHKTTMVPMYIAMGISQGVMPLVGYNFAAGNNKRMKDGVLCSAKIGAVVMTIATATFIFGSRGVVSLFMSNELIVEYGSAFIIGQALAQPFLALDFLGVGVYQACGMGRQSLIFAICRKIILEIPALIILNKLVPMYGLAYAQLVAEVILSIAAVICLKRIFDGRYSNKVKGCT